MKSAKKNSWSKISVVVSNYNGIKLNLLIESVSSILKNDYPNLEVILVDNASSDDSVKIAREKFPRLKIVRNPVNMYSEGMNLGIRNSEGKYVVFFNNDVVVKNGYFQKFIKFLEKHPKIAFAQSKLINYYNHKIIDSAGETMDPYGTPITIGAGQSARKFNKQTELLSVSGSCNVLRKSCIEDIGYFDKDYGIGYEDMDLSLRAWMMGYRVVYFPEVLAFHKRGATDLSDMVRVKVRWHFNKNRICTIIKNYPTTFILKNLPVTIFIYFAAGFWEMVIKRRVTLGLTRYNSLVWVISNLPDILKKRRDIQSKATKSGKKMIEKLLCKKGFASSFGSFLKAK